MLLAVLSSLGTPGLARAADGSPDQALADAREDFQAAQPFFGTTPWHGSLESKPVVGADLYIDRKDIGAIGRTPFTGQLEPGKHTIFVEKFGYQPLRQEIDVPAGTAAQHTLRMQPVESGWVTVTGKSTAGGRLILDDKFGCATPCRAELASGKHKLRVEKKGFEDYQSDLEVGRGVETAIEVQMSPRPARGLAITTGIVALVFLGAGAYVGSLSKSTKDSITSDVGRGVPVDNTDARFSRGKHEAIAADVLFGVGAVIAATAVYGLLEHGPDSTGLTEQHTISLAPSFGPDGTAVATGLTVWGRF